MYWLWPSTANTVDIQTLREEHLELESELSAQAHALEAVEQARAHAVDELQDAADSLQLEESIARQCRERLTECEAQRQDISDTIAAMSTELMQKQQQLREEANKAQTKQDQADEEELCYQRLRGDEADLEVRMEHLRSNTVTDNQNNVWKHTTNRVRCSRLEIAASDQQRLLENLAAMQQASKQRVAMLGEELEQESQSLAAHDREAQELAEQLAASEEHLDTTEAQLDGCNRELQLARAGHPVEESLEALERELGQQEAAAKELEKLTRNVRRKAQAEEDHVTKLEASLLERVRKVKLEAQLEEVCKDLAASKEEASSLRKELASEQEAHASVLDTSRLEAQLQLRDEEIEWRESQQAKAELAHNMELRQLACALHDLGARYQRLLAECSFLYEMQPELADLDPDGGAASVSDDDAARHALR